MSEKTVTHHDLLKTLALVLMIIDHLGLFFWPEATWLRAIGRASAPIWLFLVGYNQKSTLSPDLLAGAAVMAISQGLFMGTWLPLNILCSIMVVRLLLPLAPFVLASVRLGSYMPVVLSLLLVMVLPTALWWEYGPFAILFAAWGWWLRTAQQENAMATTPKRQGVLAYILLLALLVAYGLFSTASMGFTYREVLLMLACLLPVVLLLARFKAGVKAVTAPRVLVQMLAFCGRQTLLLYVTHYLLFILIARHIG